MQEKNELIKLVSESESLSDVLRKSGKAVSGSSINCLKKKLEDYEIDYFFLNKKTIQNKINLKQIKIKIYSQKILLNLMDTYH